jgi:hypothetical protein
VSSPTPVFELVESRIARLLPQAVRTTYAGAGHVPHVTHVTHPEEYVAGLVAFVESEEAPSRSISRHRWPVTVPRSAAESRRLRTFGPSRGHRHDRVASATAIHDLGSGATPVSPRATSGAPVSSTL